MPAKVCEHCGSTYELEAKAPEVHQHVWSVAYRSTEGEKKTTRLHCRLCPDQSFDGPAWATVDGHSGAEHKVAGLGDKSARIRGAR